jgi:hypothetical protein
MGPWNLDPLERLSRILAQPQDPPPPAVIGPAPVSEPTGWEALLIDPPRATATLQGVTGDPTEPGSLAYFTIDPNHCYEHRPLEDMVQRPLPGWADERLAHGDLHPDDQALILSLQAGTATDAQVQERYARLLHNTLNTFTGWEDGERLPANRRLMAFEQVLEVAVGYGQGEVYVRGLMTAAQSSLSVGMDDLLRAHIDPVGTIDQAALPGLDDQAFIRVFFLTLLKLRQVPLGSQELRDLFRVKTFLKTELARRAIDIEAVSTQFVRQSLPGLEERDHANFLHFSHVADTLETLDDQEARVVLIEEIRWIHDRLTQVDDVLSPGAASLYHLENVYVNLAREIGVPLFALAAIRDPQSAMSSDTSLSPELRHLFAVTGFGALLAAHRSDTVIFTDEINAPSAETLVGQVGGLSFWFEDTVMLDTMQNGTPVPSWHQASTLVHEWTHHDWTRTHFDTDPSLLKSLPNERAAYAVQREFLVALRDLSDEVASGITGYDRGRVNGLIVEVEGRMGRANRVLGYAANDFTLHHEPLAASVRGLELDHHPANLTFSD